MKKREQVDNQVKQENFTGAKGPVFFSDRPGSVYIPSKTNPILRRCIKIISIIVAILFTWQQVTWAQGGVSISRATDKVEPYLSL